MRRRTGVAVLSLVLAVAGSSISANALDAQEGLAAYDYANLGFRGVAAEVFAVYPTETESTVSYGGRLDFGYLGPHVRVQFRGAYWSSELKEEEVETFEERIADLVEEQNGARPTVDLGVIKRSAVIVGSDFHWVFAPTAVVRPYLGIGAELYILAGSGASIDDTFVEDGLDLLTVGASGIAGLEAGIGSIFSVFGEVRGSIAADIRSLAFGGGIAVHWK